MRELDASNDGQTISLSVGEHFALSLPENPTTGFRWKLTGDGTPVCKLTGDDFERASGAVGAGGTRRWTFVAERAGDADIALAHQRAWGGAAPSRAFALAVRAT